MIVLGCLTCGAVGEEPAPPDFKQWGKDVLEAVKRDFWMPKEGLYAEKKILDAAEPPQPAFMWGVGVELTALAAAARLEKETYAKPLREYAEAVQSYWIVENGVGGYDVQPHSKSADRYYDDNAWIALALLEIHEITGEKSHLDQAREVFKFIASGEDDKLGGGLYWRERERRSKNTCTNAPSIVTALRLHQITGEKAYLDAGKRWYEWTRAHLQDTDGLYWDNLHLDGTLDRRKFSYNSALMIRANVLLHEILKDGTYLDEARRMAKAGIAQWIRDDGGVMDSGRFAHLLMESFLALHQADRNPEWLKVVTNSLVRLHDHARDENGRYANRWDREVTRPVNRMMLLDQASVARAFLMRAAVDESKPDK